jgi:hypothetical protein
VQLSVDTGAGSALETVGPNGPECNGGWINVSWDLSAMALGAQGVRVRFTASDIGDGTPSTVEAGVDALRITATSCVDPVWGSCCVGSSCYDAIDQLSCNDLAGVFHASMPCEDVACGGAVEGACCFGDDCDPLTLDACNTAGGNFAGAETTCNDVVCDDGIDLPMVTTAVGRGLVSTAPNSWTTDLWVVVGEGARIDVMAGTSSQSKVLSSNGTFYQDVFGGPTSTSINPAFFPTIPDLQWDSRVTIGAIDVLGTPFPDNALQSVGIDWTTFENGGTLVVNDGAWFVLPTDAQGDAQYIMADDCSMVHAVRVARLTMESQGDIITFEGWVQGRDLNNIVFDDPARIEASFIAVDDCNSNGVSDTCDIAYGTSVDLDENGVPDECQGACPGDANGDGVSDINDILAVIGAFETTDAQTDVDGSGFVDIDDLLQVISFFGSC